MRACSRAFAFLMLKTWAVRATRPVADDHQTTGQHAVADDSDLTAVLARVLDLKSLD